MGISINPVVGVVQENWAGTPLRCVQFCVPPSGGRAVLATFEWLNLSSLFRWFPIGTHLPDVKLIQMIHEMVDFP